MKKTFVLAGVVLALTASLASAEGINLSWDDCGTNGGAVKTFDCASNTGLPFNLVASFIPPANVNQFLGLSSQIDFTSASAALPQWWRHGTGECRSTNGIGVNFNFTSGPFSCVDFYVGAAAGGYAYDIGYGTPNRARMRIQCAVPFENRGAVSSSSEYYAYMVSLLRSKSTGTGFCAGCEEPMCIVLNEIQLFQPPEANFDPSLTTPATRNFVTWQAPTVPGCPLSTPNVKSSWGQVKSLYR